MNTQPNHSILKGHLKELTFNHVLNVFEDLAIGAAANNIAVTFENGAGFANQLTYNELNSLSNQIAGELHKLKITHNLKCNQAGDYIIGVSMQPSDRLIVTLLAIWKARAAYLPLDINFPEDRVKHILMESEPSMIIHDQDRDYLGNLFNISYKCLLANSEIHLAFTLENKLLVRSESDLAIVLYTSGSTGVPKGVKILHSAIANRLNWQLETFPFGQSEKTCVFKTALTFVDSVCEAWGPLVSGRSLVVLPHYYVKNPEILVDILERYKVERIVLVPSLLSAILTFLEIKENSSKKLNHLKIWVCSGEPLSTSLATNFFKYFSSNEHKLCNFYGSTEVMGDVAFFEISEPKQLQKQNKVPIGHPINNTVLYLLDNEYKPVKAGSVGELYVSGQNISAGYVNKRDGQMFLDNPFEEKPIFSKIYKTGDLARVINGYLYYEGRTDSQIKIRGHRIDLSEIEKVIISTATVENATVLCYNPGEINQTLLAFVTPKCHLWGKNEIEKFLKNKLLSYMVPQVVCVESIPYLINGKIDRQTLLKKYESSNNDLHPHMVPDYTNVNSFHKKGIEVLFETIASVLMNSTGTKISLNSNFYEIGGNSLNSIYIISKLYQKGISDFISASNLGEILENMTSTNNKTKCKISSRYFTSEPLKLEHQQVVRDIVSTSFYEKADLEKFIIDNISKCDFEAMVDDLYQPLLDQNLSFVAKDATGNIVGVSLNIDGWDDPPIETDTRLAVIWEFEDSLEKPIRNSKLPKGKGKIFQSSMIATCSSLTASRNVALIAFLESKILELAKCMGFEGVFTTNTSPVTQQLATDIFGYETLINYQINQFVAEDKTKPFASADDSQRVLVQWKKIS